MTTYQVICWFANIRPEDRNSTTLSDGAIFSTEDAAREFANRVVRQGGKISYVRVRENGTAWWESVAEYDRAGLMTSGELEAIGRRGR